VSLSRPPVFMRADSFTSTSPPFLVKATLRNAPLHQGEKQYLTALNRLRKNSFLLKGTASVAAASIRPSLTALKWIRL